MSTLEIRGLTASVAGKQILNGVDLTVRSGEVHAVMGPNGAARARCRRRSWASRATRCSPDRCSSTASTCSRCPRGTRRRRAAPRDAVPDRGARRHARRRPGRGAPDAGRSTDDLRTAVCGPRPLASTSRSASSPPLNVDLSGGEKKRNETLQLAVLRPKIAILDELDSGLDIDALRDCSRRVEDLSNDAEHPLGVLAITHYSRLLEVLRPDHVHILVKGRIVASGGPSSPTARAGRLRGVRAGRGPRRGRPRAAA
jgi:Fe-S cluster assembly ATP-binding protein